MLPTRGAAPALAPAAPVRRRLAAGPPLGSDVWAGHVARPAAGLSRTAAAAHVAQRGGARAGTGVRGERRSWAAGARLPLGRGCARYADTGRHRAGVGRIRGPAWRVTPGQLRIRVTGDHGGLGVPFPSHDQPHRAPRRARGRQLAWPGETSHLARAGWARPRAESRLQALMA